MEAYFEGLGMTTLSTLSRLYKCCPALMYLSVKNNQIQDVNEITKLHGLRLKGFGVDGNPIQASPEEINRIIRQTFPLIITGKMIQFPVFTFMSLQTLPQPKFNMVTKTDFPPSAEVTEINAIAEGFMKMFILNRFARPHIDEHYAPNATVSIIENRMYARRDALGRSGGTFFLNKEYTRGAENISHLLAQRLKGRFPITNSCYTIDYNVFAGCMCVLTICGFVRSTESAFTRTIVFGKDPASGKSLITNDIINIWVERGPNIISYLNPMSAISDRTTIEALSAAPPPPSAQAPLMTPEEAKYVEALSAASGLPIHVVTEYIQKSGKTREQVESDLSNPAFVNEIKARIQSLGL